MIKRDAFDAVVRLAGQFPVIAITGPRQSGKTTLAKMAFPEKRYVSLDDKNMRLKKFLPLCIENTHYSCTFAVQNFEG